MTEAWQLPVRWSMSSLEGRLEEEEEEEVEAVNPIPSPGVGRT